MELINQKIENIDISDIESIKLVANDYKTIQIKSENFYKVVKMILDNTKKTSFEPNELESIYTYILAHYETSLGEETYKKVQEVLSIFVKNGGKVEVTYKKPIIDNKEIPLKNNTDNVITWKKVFWSVLLVLFVQFIAWITGMIIFLLLNTMFSDKDLQLVITSIVSIILQFSLYITLAKKVFKLNTKKAFILLLLTLLTFIGIFLVLCGGLILVISGF